MLDKAPNFLMLKQTLIRLKMVYVCLFVSQPSVCRPVVAGRMVSPDGGVAVSFQSTFPPAVSSPSVVSAGVAPLQCLPPGHLQGNVGWNFSPCI